VDHATSAMDGRGMDDGWSYKITPFVVIIERKILGVLSIVFSWRSPCSVFLAFSQSYVKHDLRKNKIVVVSTTIF
jgi:hypothetical protein